mmetsp:Transcript_13043/g.40679  ORF Transcript_13043/g.40679 Transcript_13043/m.40679 type:complete len:214 (+) Transcript_13043:274-915(+)
MSLAPVAPSGWPSAMALPLTLSFSWSAPSALAHEPGTDAKASLTSYRSIWSSDMPAFLSAFLVAGMGPSSITTGSVPASASATTRARALAPLPARASACRPRSLTIITAAAPSEICEAVPGVSTPPGAIGFSLASFSTVVFGRMPSSRVCSEVRPSSSSTSTGTISLSKAPRAKAAAPRACERAAMASSSARVSWYFLASISAPANCENCLPG